MNEADTLKEAELIDVELPEPAVTQEEVLGIFGRMRDAEERRQSEISADHADTQAFHHMDSDSDFMGAGPAGMFAEASMDGGGAQAQGVHAVYDADASGGMFAGASMESGAGFQRDFSDHNLGMTGTGSGNGAIGLPSPRYGAASPNDYPNTMLEGDAEADKIEGSTYVSGARCGDFDEAVAARFAENDGHNRFF